LLSGVTVATDLAAQQKTKPPATATVAFPGFRVKVALSDKAKKTLAQRKETIVVVASFTGTPKKGAEKYGNEIGEIGLGEANSEVAPGEDAVFGEIKLKQDLLAHLDDQGPQLLINVTSGSKSSKNNLLSCGIYEGALKPIPGGIINISCKLI